jgi:hypothetical protein
VIIAILLNGSWASGFTYVSDQLMGNRRWRWPGEYDAVAELLMGHRGPRAPLP